MCMCVYVGVMYVCVLWCGVCVCMLVWCMCVYVGVVYVCVCVCMLVWCMCIVRSPYPKVYHSRGPDSSLDSGYRLSDMASSMER